MIVETGAGLRRAEALKTAFDRSFAVPEAPAAEPTAEFLMIHVGGDPHLLRLEDVSELQADRRIERIPSSVADFAGLARFRSALLPVYDLAALLGYPRPAASRWTVVAAAAPLALRFEHFVGHCRLPIAQVSEAGTARRHVNAVAAAGTEIRPVICIASLANAIMQRRAGTTA